MDELRYQGFSPAPGEEFASRWQFEFSRDGKCWCPFREYPHLFDVTATYYRIRYWTHSGEEIVTAPSTRTIWLSGKAPALIR